MSWVRQRSGLLVALLLTAPLLGACEKGPPAPTEKPVQIGVDWAGDKSHLFELELTTTTRLGSAPGAPPVILRTGMELSFRGSAERKQVLIQLRDPHLVDAAGKPATDAAAFESELAKTFAVELSRGVMQAYFEPASPAAPVAGFRRHLVTVLQLGDHAPANTWTSPEWDATGLSKVEYRAVADADRSWDWKRLAYERLIATDRRAAASLDTSKVMPQVERATGRVVTDAAGIVSATRDETLSVPLSGSTKLTTQLVLELRRKSFGQVASAELWDQTLKTSTRAEVGTPAAMGDQSALTDQARIGSHTFSELVASLTALEAKQGGAPAPAGEAGPLFHALVGIFRQQPETVDAALKLVRARSPISDTLLDALAMASTKQSLDSVGALALDASMPEAVRLRAAGSFIRAHDPGQYALELAVKMVDQPLLRENALYGIGSFVRQLRDRGDKVVADAGAKVLAQQLKTSATPSDRATVLLAISNSGSAELFDAAVGYQQDPNSTVRQAAIQAIRLMPQPEVETQLREVLGRKDRGDVLAALHALGRRPQATRESVDRVEGIARRDPSGEIRREAVLVLSLWSRTWPALVPVLADIREHDTDARVRDVAKPVGSP